MLAGIGEKLRVLDLSGSVMSALTDAGLTSVVRHCQSLTGLHVSMHKHITGRSLLPLFNDQQRAQTLLRLNLSCKLVHYYFTFVILSNN